VSPFQQRDGPALRATAVITLANYLLDRHNETYVKNTLWPIITLDLNYVAQYWNQTGVGNPTLCGPTTAANRSRSSISGKKFERRRSLLPLPNIAP
jgi:hypothetical protein